MNLNKLFLNKNTKKNLCSILSLILCNGLTSNIALADKNHNVTEKTTYIADSGVPDYSIVPGGYHANIIHLNGRVAYCLENHKDTPTHTEYTPEGDLDNHPQADSIKAILYHGYPNNGSNIFDVSTPDKEETARKQTSFAIWEILSPGSNGDWNNFPDPIKQLIIKAQAGDYPRISFETNTKNPSMTTNADGSQISEVINTSGRTGTFTFPSDGDIWSTDTNGNPKSTFDIGESFRIAAKSSVTGATTRQLSVTMNQQTMEVFRPLHDDSFQKLGIPSEKPVQYSADIALNFRDPVAQVKIIKTDAKDTTKLLEGVKFGIYNENTDALVAELTTDVQGEALSANLPLGNYYAKELQSKEGYVLDSTKHKFSLVADGSVITLNITNDRIVGELSFSKTDFATSEIVPGATIKIEGISDHNKDFVTEFISDEKGNKIYLEYGKYKITETIAPEGYVKTEETAEFEIKQNGEIVKAELKNKKIVGKLSFSKTDFTDGEIVPGATIKIEGISDHNKNFVTEFVTNDKPTEIELEYGKYKITETIAPEGYVKTEETAEFEIKQNGEIVKAELKNKRIVGTLSFSKTDFTSGEIVPGATIKIEGISNHNKDFVAEFISSVDGNRIELEYGKYKITEIIAPEGYVKTEETGEFEIKQDGEIVKAELKNKRITGSLNILKIDSNTKEALSGAIFGVYNKDMELIEKLTSDSKGLASIETLYYGDYIIKELEAPNGYTAIKENIEFSIKEDGQIVDITIKNDKVKVLSQNLPFAGGLNTGLILAISTITALASLKILKKK